MATRRQLLAFITIAALVLLCGFIIWYFASGQMVDSSTPSDKEVRQLIIEFVENGESTVGSYLPAELLPFFRDPNVRKNLENGEIVRSSEDQGRALGHFTWYPHEKNGRLVIKASASSMYAIEFEFTRDDTKWKMTPNGVSHFSGRAPDPN